jgi:hypothetical protein
MRWSRNPIIYEINTWVWLKELSERHKQPISLATVPDSEWDAIAGLPVDAVWFMGVWERSPIGRQIANENAGLQADFQRALPDFRPEDNVGSPYCVRQYVVDEHLGGNKGLASCRAKLAERGLQLLLDFVPNHVAPDHPWVVEHPEYFIQGSAEDLRNSPAAFIEVNGAVLACGRDPYFPAWPDVVQLNAFAPGLRSAVINTLLALAEQCDGVRCDMAMLLISDIFKRTWGERAGSFPSQEYWIEVIQAVKKQHPDFLFIAEAYWDMEWTLQQLGFDYCYDKRLYDRLEHEDANSIRGHLTAAMDYQQKLVRFIENHDEPRARAAFSPAKERAAAITTTTVPGAKIFHEGQLEGRQVRLPVFLGRRPAEAADPSLQAFYQMLFGVARLPAIREGEWRLCERSGWNDSYQNLVAWCWHKQGEGCLIVVNLSDHAAQGNVQVPLEALPTGDLTLTDIAKGISYVRNGSDMRSPGLYVDLGGWDFHIFQFEC